MEYNKQTDNNNNKEINEQTKLDRNEHIHTENRVVVTRGEGVGRADCMMRGDPRLLVVSTLPSTQELKYNVVHMKRVKVINQCYLNKFLKSVLYKHAPCYPCFHF